MRRRSANCKLHKRSSTLSNVCSQHRQGNAESLASVRREHRPIQFGQPVDIDIDSQTTIQPRCIYMSQPSGNVCVALPPAPTLCDRKASHLSARTHCAPTSAGVHTKIITRHTYGRGVYSRRIKGNGTLQTRASVK